MVTSDSLAYEQLLTCPYKVYTGPHGYVLQFWSVTWFDTQLEMQQKRCLDHVHDCEPGLIDVAEPVVLP